MLATMGYLQRDVQAWKWSAAGYFLYAFPFFALVLRWNRAFFLSFWTAIFFFLQSLLSISVYRNHISLKPLHETRIRYTKSKNRGFDGLHVIRTDEKGYRTTHPVRYMEKSQKIRLFALGGSTTEEIYIGNDRTWTGTLESLRPQLEVVNTGVSGLLSAHHVDTLFAIERYHPDIITVLVGVNDWNKQIRSHFAAGGIPDEPSRFAIRKTALGNLLRIIYDDPKAFFQSLSQKKNEKPDVLEDALSNQNSLNRPETREYFPDRVSAEFERSIQAIAKRCNKIQARCLFITQPHGYNKNVSPELRQYMWMTPPGEPTYNVTMESLVHIASLYNHRLIEIASENHIPYCDIASEFKTGLVDFYDDVHFNPHGSLHVAERVAQCLDKLLL